TARIQGFAAYGMRVAISLTNSSDHARGFSFLQGKAEHAIDVVDVAFSGVQSSRKVRSVDEEQRVKAMFTDALNANRRVFEVNPRSIHHVLELQEGWRVSYVSTGTDSKGVIRLVAVLVRY
ncbi:MAG: hypothetical protein MJA83_06230, partial [Gammaproteobacteria bacterium]|nr:hypothetical protein [Gammaproteobacteria bacterium]